MGGLHRRNRIIDKLLPAVLILGLLLVLVLVGYLFYYGW